MNILWNSLSNQDVNKRRFHRKQLYDLHWLAKKQQYKKNLRFLIVWIYTDLQ